MEVYKNSSYQSFELSEMLKKILFGKNKYKYTCVPYELIYCTLLIIFKNIYPMECK